MFYCSPRRHLEGLAMTVTRLAESIGQQCRVASLHPHSELVSVPMERLQSPPAFGERIRIIQLPNPSNIRSKEICDNLVWPLIYPRFKTHWLLPADVHRL